MPQSRPYEIKENQQKVLKKEKKELFGEINKYISQISKPISKSIWNRMLRGPKSKRMRQEFGIPGLRSPFQYKNLNNKRCFATPSPQNRITFRTFFSSVGKNSSTNTCSEK